MVDVEGILGRIDLSGLNAEDEGALRVALETTSLENLGQAIRNTLIKALAGLMILQQAGHGADLVTLIIYAILVGWQHDTSEIPVPPVPEVGTTGDTTVSPPEP